MNKKKPDFVLDCTAAASKLPQYNGLRDSNLVYFFSGKKKRKQLFNLGLINKQGIVLDKNKTLGSTRAVCGGSMDPSFTYARKSNKGNIKPVSKDQFQALIATARKLQEKDDSTIPKEGEDQPRSNTEEEKQNET